MIYIKSLVLFTFIERSLKMLVKVFARFERVVKGLRMIYLWVFSRFSWLRENIKKKKEKGVSQGF